MWLLTIAIFPFFSCPLLTASVDTGSPHFSFLQGTGQADQYCEMHFILCPLLPLHSYQKQKDCVPEGGLRILPSCYLWCSGGIFSKGCWCCSPGEWLGEERVGQERPGRAKGCREGVTQQRSPWWLCACAGTAHTQPQWQAVWEQLKKLEPPVQPFEGKEEIPSCSVTNHFSSWKISGVTWNVFSVILGFHSWTFPPNLQIQRDLYVAIRLWLSFPRKQIKIEPSTLTKFASYPFLWKKKPSSIFLLYVGIFEFFNIWN